MSNIKYICADCLSFLKDIENNTYDAVLCDPPYALTSGKNSKKGFMEKEWDAAIPSIETWKEILRVCKPGAHLLAFGGCRTFHRLMVSIEDAGWKIKDTLCWLYASGMPKGCNISKQIDKKAGAEREIISEGSPVKRMIPGADVIKTGSWIKNNDRIYIPTVTIPTTESAKQWEGYNTALKPAWEPIVLAMKPLDGTYVNNALEHGCGSLNIDDCRIRINEEIDDPRLGGKGVWKTDKAAKRVYSGGYAGENIQSHTGGRYPANIVLTHHPECKCLGKKKIKGSGTSKKFHKGYDGKSNTGFIKGVSHPGNQHADQNGKETIESWACHPDCPISMLDNQSGILKSGDNATRRKEGFFLDHGGLGGPGDIQTTYGDRGYASRFFYCGKVSIKERNAGGCDNKHPTIKPIKLTEYLAKLLLPPKSDKNRSILVPYAGSGSEMIGCMLAGWDTITGIELHQEYLDIAQIRMKYFMKPKNTKVDLFDNV